MRAVNFTVRAGVSPERQGELMREIGTWPSIHKASMLRAGAANPAVRQMSYVLLEDDADIDAVVARLAAHPDIESASVPARRGLA
jgi:hypothetical protein